MLQLNRPLPRQDFQTKTVPAKPGIYLLKDAQDNVLYVGKAANLHNRVRAYFVSPYSLSPKHQRLVARIKDIEFIVTDSEQEALILECNLIKKYRPRYNVRLKDDKTFPYLKVDLNEDWPRVYITRRFIKDGARYFGPFASASSVRRTLRLIKKIFPFRSCTKAITSSEPRPCLDYHIQRCLGPCLGTVPKEEYREVINQVILFLEGKQELVIKDLRHKMEAASNQLQFEKAAWLRDQIQAVEKVIEGQKIATTIRGDQDVIALAQTKDQACIQIFFVRNGKLLGREPFILEGVQEEEPSQVMTSFIKQYYTSAPTIPPLILLQYPVDDEVVITQWLKTQRQAPVKLMVPRKGAKKQLVDLVAQNAQQQLDWLKAQSLAISETMTALEELQERLKLPRVPLRVEGYDISNIGGALAVGSMVVFQKGVPKPVYYRRFKIKTIVGADDYAMLREVLRRRFRRCASGEDSWTNLPDLVLVDGGKGQLNAALSVIKELGIDPVPVVSLAKEREEVFIPTLPEPVNFPNNSPALYLLQRLRDEAHRFALGYHQKLRHKEGLGSILDSIPGIGAKRKSSLIKKFGSIHGIKEASVAEIASVKGMTKKLAVKVKEYL